MKITFLCHEYPPRAHGGLGTFVRVIATALASSGHEITILELGEFAKTRVSEGVKIVSLPMSKARFLGMFLNRWRIAKWVNRAFGKGEIDILEVPDFEGWLPFRLACPVVVRLHA